jgi:cysteine desulfurase
MFGGGQQLEVRPGTEPVVLADSLAWAVRLSCQARQAGEYQRLAGLRDKLERSLVALGDVFIVAADSPRLPHVSNAAFLGLDRQALQMALDFAGIACSTGSACASGSGRPSHVLAAMGLDNSIISSSIRFSLSRMTTADEIDSASRIVAEVVTKLRSKRLRAM